MKWFNFRERKAQMDERTIELAVELEVAKKMADIHDAHSEYLKIQFREHVDDHNKKIDEWTDKQSALGRKHYMEINAHNKLIEDWLGAIKDHMLKGD